MRSIRHHLLVHFLSRVLPLVVLGCVGLFFGLRYVLVQDFDENLRSEAAALASLAERVGSGVDFDYDIKSMPDFMVHPSPDYFELWLNDGSVLERSASLEGKDLPRMAGDPEEGKIAIAGLPDGRIGRLCVMVFEPRAVPPPNHGDPVLRPDAPAGPVTIVVGRGTEDITHPLAVLGLSLGALGLLLVGGIVLVIRWSVRYGLSPLDRLGQRVTQIDPASLHERVDTHGLPRELRPIAGRLNELLARLHESFERERRFAASAAHELRTPVAEVRTLAEVALRQVGDEGRTRANLGGIVEVSEQMAGVIDSLLGMARAKSNADRMQLAMLDVSGVVEDLWARRADKAKARGLRATLRLEPGMWIESDAATLSSIISNVLDNAVGHAPERGEVLVTVTGEGGAVRVRVENTVSDLEQSDLARMFDPFWRKDRVRGEATHSGLGLALVRVLSEVVGAKVWVELSGPRFAINVKFPGAPRGSRSKRGEGPEATIREPEGAGARR